ncbi:DUF1995 domain-containing protein [Psidium guajava]|nr:DUF1995 domain-containing protein [Psidium guajava]
MQHARDITLGIPGGSLGTAGPFSISQKCRILNLSCTYHRLKSNRCSMLNACRWLFGHCRTSCFGLPMALWALPDSTQPVALIGTAGPRPRRRRLRPVPQLVSIHTEVGTLVSPATPCRARSGASATTVA